MTALGVARFGLAGSKVAVVLCLSGIFVESTPLRATAILILLSALFVTLVAVILKAAGR